MDKKRISSHVLTMVCDAVEIVFAVNGRPLSVDRDSLFHGVRSEQNIAARFFLFRTLHDIYGYSYTDISRLSGIGTRNVMRAVGKIRGFIFSDPLYSAIKQEIDNHITQGINLL